MDNAAAAVPDVPAESQHSSGERYWEIDAIRGIAILGMIFFHILAAMVMFHIIEETETFLKFYNTYVFGTAIFVLLAGIAMILRHERMQKRGATDRDYNVTLVNRSFLLFGIAMLITVITWIAYQVFLDTNAAIVFGFLHMLSISMLIAIPLLRFKKWNLLFGLAVMAVGFFVIPCFTSPEWLFPLGIHSAEFLNHTPDYFPLFPWTGVLLLGVGLGNVFYPNGIRGFTLNYKPGKFLQAMAKLGNGMVTLFIYITHMPVIYVVLWIFGSLTGIGYL